MRGVPSLRRGFFWPLKAAFLPAREVELGKDPQSLDAAVQNTLSGLYPPFDATAPTVLSQLFRVLEADYRGDGLCCLLDFLIPAKRLLEHVRQAACAPYFSCVFLHEGWPLCLREKVVVHLGPLNPLLVRPGDFYLQVEPCGEQSACLVVKCLSTDLATVEKIPVPEASCSLLFTQEWLEETNRDLDRPTLHTCLVATGNGIVPVPWSRIATPEFVNVPQADGSVEQEWPGCLDSHRTSDAQRPRGSIAGGLRRGADGGLGATRGKYPGLIKVEQGPWKKSTLFVVPSLCDIISENLEGEYVHLVDFSEESKRDNSSSVAPPASPEPGREASPQTGRGLLWGNADEATTESWTCGKGPGSEEGPCTPCLRRKLSPDPKQHESRCRYRESYVAALKNPVSFSSGLMAAILEEMDLSKGASPSEGAGLAPLEKSGQDAPRVPSGPPSREGKADEGSRQGFLKLRKSPTECPAAGNKFSLLKGPRQLGSAGGGLAVPEKACKGPEERPRKGTALVCSPKTARARPAAAGKGTSLPDVRPSDFPPPKSPEGPAGSAPTPDALLRGSLPPAPGPQEPDLWELLSPDLLSSGVVCLPGNTDKLGRRVIQVSTGSRAWQAPWCSATDVTQLLLCLCSIPRYACRKLPRDSGLTVVVDARKELPPPALSAALGAVQRASPGSIHTVLLLAEKEAASHLEKLPGVQVELLSSLKALSRHVDPSQWTPALDGPFPYCHSEWVQYFQKMRLFVRDLKEASELLSTTTRELQEGALPETLQGAQQQMDRHRQLMQEVLSNARLVSLQREGGATLARLRKEAARLSFSPDVRHSIDGTLALYNLVEEEVHTLVTQSNSRLEHLEFLLRIRALQAEFDKLGWWFDGEGGAQLSAVGPAESSLESTEESYRRFKAFFKEATVGWAGRRPLEDAGEAELRQRIQTCLRNSDRVRITASFTGPLLGQPVLVSEIRVAPPKPKASLSLEVHYNQGLSLSKEAAKVQCSKFPEMGAFEEAKGAFQAKLTLFYMDMEMKGAELETLLDLYRFRDKVAQLDLACRQRLALWGAAEDAPRSPELLQETQASLRLLAEEFSAERLQQVKAQAASMRHDRGLAVWGETLAASQEARRLLEDTLAKCREAQARGAQDGAERGPRFGPDSGPACTAPKEGLGGDGASARTVKGEAAPERGRLEAEGGLVGGSSFRAAPSLEDPVRGEARPASLEAGALEAQHSCRESPARPAPAEASCPHASPGPGARESPACTSLPARGRHGRKKEAAQYFQLSRQGSFSSEDTDSQTSTEDSLSGSATLPADSPGPLAAGSPDKSRGIVYLENHSASRAAAALALSGQ
ncbi:hypothetical protein lerEdw1_005009 [Lerista edwardsae]|nr:hypothetical protein lerEdw1_005009 [Lerista edwardsae]